MIHEGHGWGTNNACASQWSDWQLATPDALAGVPRRMNLQYKYTDIDSGAYYLTPVTQLVWSWSRYQGLSGEYMFVTADGTQDAFQCTDTEQGMVGVGCSNGGGAEWKVFSWDRPLEHAFPERAETQVCQDHPDAFEIGACGQGVISFRTSSTNCDPERLHPSWTVIATDTRVSDPEEDRDESPWEWRSNEVTLEECKAECMMHESCMGIEFESADGSSDCIMLRRAGTFHRSEGWTVMARPGIAASSPVARQQDGGASGIGGFLNANFDNDDVCSYVCQSGSEVDAFDGQLCGHHYVRPSAWEASGGSVLICNANSGPWGGLNSGFGTGYLSIQGTGAYVQQAVSGLTPGQAYEISFWATHRPGYGDDEAFKVLADGLEIFHTEHPGSDLEMGAVHGGDQASFHGGDSDPFQQYTAIFQARGDMTVIRFENDSPGGDKSVFIDNVVIRDGRGWTADAACEALFSDWQLATPTNLQQIQPGADLQYKYELNNAYYLTPTTSLVWDWNRYQALSGDYVFVDPEGYHDAFACTDTEQGHSGIGCSNGGGAAWK